MPLASSFCLLLEDVGYINFAVVLSFESSISLTSIATSEGIILIQY